jgi:hypothetical protein
VDRMGKDVSGVGMDPNVLERSANPTTNYFSKGSAQKIRRVFVRDLTDGTHGNALGLGNAEFTTRRLIDKMDLQATYMNCITANDPWSGRIPLYFDNDRQAMEAALKTIGNVAPSDARIVHISDTSYLEKMEISEAMVEDAMGHENVEIHQRGRAMRFDRKGNLISRFAKT